VIGGQCVGRQDNVRLQHHVRDDLPLRPAGQLQRDGALVGHRLANGFVVHFELDPPVRRDQLGRSRRQLNPRIAGDHRRQIGIAADHIPQ